jgi:hypothetical protein
VRVSVKLQREGQQQVQGAQMTAVPPLPAYKSWAFLPANERALHTGLRMFYIDATGARPLHTLLIIPPGVHSPLRKLEHPFQYTAAQ